jgi:hypothetical protein
MMHAQIEKYTPGFYEENRKTFLYDRINLPEGMYIYKTDDGEIAYKQTADLNVMSSSEAEEFFNNTQRTLYSMQKNICKELNKDIGKELLFSVWIQIMSIDIDDLTDQNIDWILENNILPSDIFNQSTAMQIQTFRQLDAQRKIVDTILSILGPGWDEPTAKCNRVHVYDRQSDDIPSAKRQTVCHSTYVDEPDEPNEPNEMDESEEISAKRPRSMY